MFHLGVQRDGLCRPGHTLVFCQSSAGSLVGSHKRTIFEELWQRAVNLSHSPWRTHSHWNRHCMDTGNLSAAKAFGYTAPHPLQDLCVSTPWSATALPMKIPFTPCIDLHPPLLLFPSSLPEDLWACSSALLIRIFSLNSPGHGLKFPPHIRSCHLCLLLCRL